MSVAAEARVGTTFAQYRIDALVGRGGMSVVYRAYDPRLDRNVALKLLAPELTLEAGFRERFLRESRLAASLDHPHVVPVFDAGEHEGQLYIAMRFVDGTDLKALVRREGALGPERSTTFLDHLASALDAAHARELLHRDVKSANALVDADGNVYLADFGLTRHASEAGDPSGLARTLGTADYVAPELLEGAPGDRRADVYSLGCLYYECLTGQVPFVRDSELAVLWAHVRDAPPRPSERVESLPDTVDAVVAQAMAKRPEDRFETAGELARAARQALGLERRGATSTRLLVAAAAAVLVAAATAITVVLSTRDTVPTELSPSTDQLVRVDTASNDVTNRYRVGRGVSGVAVGAGYVWVTSVDDSVLWRVDPGSGERRRIEGLVQPQGVAVRDGVAYVSNMRGIAFVEAAGTPTSSEGNAFGYPPLIAAGPDGVWAASSGSVGAVESAGISLTEVTRLISVQAPNTGDHELGFFGGLAAGAGVVWVSGGVLEHLLFRVDTGRRSVTRYPLPGESGAVAIGAGAVWVAGIAEDVVWRIDPSTGRVTDAVDVGRAPAALAFGAGGLWVASSIDGTIEQIDPGARSVSAAIDVGGVPNALAVEGGHVWVVTRAV